MKLFEKGAYVLNGREIIEEGPLAQAQLEAKLGRSITAGFMCRRIRRSFISLPGRCLQAAVK